MGSLLSVIENGAPVAPPASEESIHKAVDACYQVWCTANAAKGTSGFDVIFAEYKKIKDSVVNEFLLSDEQYCKMMKELHALSQAKSKKLTCSSCGYEITPKVENYCKKLQQVNMLPKGEYLCPHCQIKANKHQFDVFKSLKP